MPIQPVLTAAAASVATRVGGAPLDPERLLPVARAVVKVGPLDLATIRERLQEDLPDVNDRVLGYALGMHLPLVMVPTADRWAFPSSAGFTLAEHRPRLVTRNLRVPASFLWGGLIRGTWQVTRRKDSATLTLAPFEPLPVRAETDLTQEAQRLLNFAEPGAAKLAVQVAAVG